MPVPTATTIAIAEASDTIPNPDDIAFPGEGDAPATVTVGSIAGVDWALAPHGDDICLRLLYPGTGSWSCSPGDVVATRPLDTGTGVVTFVAGAAPRCAATVTVDADGLDDSRTVPVEPGADDGAWFVVALPGGALAGPLVAHDDGGAEVRTTRWATEVPVRWSDDC